MPLDMDLLASIANNKIKVINLFYTRINTEDAMDLAGALHSSESVEEITLNDAWISDYEIHFIAEALDTTHTLRILRLSNNKIGSEGMYCLHGVLQTVVEINLDSNPIGTKGALIAADALQHNSVITLISLTSCKIGSQGAKVLVEVVSGIRSITTLELGNNNIDDTAATTLQMCLSHTTSLTYLSLSFNKFSSSGACAIARGLTKNISVQKIFLSANQIGVNGVVALANALENNFSVQVLSVMGNSASRQQEDAVEELTARNRSLLFFAKQSPRHSSSSIISTRMSITPRFFKSPSVSSKDKKEDTDDTDELKSDKDDNSLLYN